MQFAEIENSFRERLSRLRTSFTHSGYSIETIGEGIEMILEADYTWKSMVEALDPSKELITGVFVAAQVLTFVVGFGYLFIRVWPCWWAVRRTVKQLNKEFPAKKDLTWAQLVGVSQIIGLKSPLTDAWGEFRESLAQPDKDLNKPVRNTLDAEHFFSADRILQGNVSVAFLSWFPSTLVSLGILGTFLGLLLGLGGLDMAPNKLSESIGQLIGNMKLAFTTSLWGIGFAIVFSLLEKIAIGKFRKQLYNVQSWLDHRVKRVTTVEVLNEIAGYQRESTNALRSFGTDLAGMLQQAMQTALKETLEPGLLELSSHMQRVGGMLSGNQMENMDKVVSSMLDQLNQAMGGQFDALGESIRELCAWQKDTQSQLHGLTGQLSDLAASLSSAEQQLSTGVNTLSHAQGLTTELHEKLAVVVNGLSQSATFLNDHSDKATRILSGQDKTLASVVHASEAISQSQTQIVQVWQQTQQNLQSASTSLTDNLESYVNQTREAIATFGNDLDEQTAKSLLRLNQTVVAMRDVLESLPDELASAIEGTKTDMAELVVSS